MADARVDENLDRTAVTLFAQPPYRVTRRRERSQWLLFRPPVTNRRRSRIMDEKYPEKKSGLRDFDT